MEIDEHIRNVKIAKAATCMKKIKWIKYKESPFASESCIDSIGRDDNHSISFADVENILAINEILKRKGR